MQKFCREQRKGRGGGVCVCVSVCVCVCAAEAASGGALEDNVTKVVW